METLKKLGTEIFNLGFAWIRLVITVLIHKYYIFIWGLRLRVPLWQLLIHDWSKLISLSETKGYLSLYLETKSTKSQTRYQKAWLFHQNRHPHHYEYWLCRENGQLLPLPMPMKYVREMVCDWIAANKAYAKDKSLLNTSYFINRTPKMLPQLHQTTRKRIVKVLTHELPVWGEVDPAIVKLFAE